MEFETLRQMCEADQIDWRIEGTAGPWFKLSEARRQEYARLIRELRLERGVERDREGVISFNVSCVGLVTSGNCKGFVYSVAAMSPTFNDLDDAVFDRLRGGGVGYRSIEEHWYVFLAR
jgi:hypothetical protein